MFPIEKFTITHEKQKDGAVHLRGHLVFGRTQEVNAADNFVEEVVEKERDKMRAKLWETIYGDLHEPLYELMLLARRAARGNPSSYPEEARIEELTRELGDLLDWRKQLAVKQEEDTK